MGARGPCRGRRGGAVHGLEGPADRGVERELAESQQTIEILKAATGFFARECDPLYRSICGFIDEHRERFGVVPICRALSARAVQIAPRTYYAWRRRGARRSGRCGTPRSPRSWPGSTSPTSAGGARRSRCTGREDVGASEPSGHRGGPVHGGTVDAGQRLAWGATAAAGSAPPSPTGRTPGTGSGRAAVPGPGARTGCSSPTSPTCPPIGGSCYTAFVIDAYAGTIVGWHVDTPRPRRLVSRALAHALELRARQGHPVATGAIHHSDAGTQYTSIALRGSTCPRPGSSPRSARRRRLRQRPGRNHDRPVQNRVHPGRITVPPRAHSVIDVEAATADWVHWYNTTRLMHRLGRRPPAEAETEYYAQHRPTRRLKLTEWWTKPGTVHAVQKLTER